MVLLFLESIGTTELLVILVVALVVFGPRRLPELGRKLGKSMNEFRRVSDDFKRTWEREVDLDRYERERAAESAPLPAGETHAPPAALADANDRGPTVVESAESISRGARPVVTASAADLDAGPQHNGANVAATSEPAEPSSRKADWL